MSAHVLLNLLNTFRKRDKMRGCLRFVIVVFPDHTHLLFLAEHFICFRNEFNKFNHTRARMLDSIYHMALRLL